MKKAEAISILATSARPREPKDRARYDEAVRMAIEALKCSETPKSSEQTAESTQEMSRLDDIIADVVYILDTLIAYRNIAKTGNCNNCRMARPKSCPYLPKPGQQVRYNCPFYKCFRQEVEGNK